MVAGAALPDALRLAAWWTFGGWGLPYIGTLGLCMLSVVGPIVACADLVIVLTNSDAAREGADEEKAPPSA